ncbi:MAG TPA: serine/threonine-protein kinase [Dictyobacter sp.]|jgi:serine/threonine protein kinase|nr:serine/threonine-protein kinase [Dictyobacter sp.]
MITTKVPGEQHMFSFRFGNYHLYRLLRRGSISTIYQGEHSYLGNKVAIKVLNSWMVTPEHCKRFNEEARLHASLRHPNIVRVLDFGVRNNIPFMVMDYATRGTLSQYFPLNTPVHLKLVLPFIIQISEALQYLHNHNFIHRDIKPQNMLLGPANTLWLSDFGITIALQPWSAHKHYTSVGTATYVAPEQIEGYPRIASDQYSLAILIYHWLCGRPPFIGTSLQLCQQHLYMPPPPLRDFQPDIPRAVEAIILKALTKDPYQRYMCIQDFTNDLQHALHDSTATPITDRLPIQHLSPHC